MIGKNNKKLKVFKQGTKVEAYGIKKFKVGAASVVIGASIFFGAGIAAASEEAVNNTADVNVTNASDESVTVQGDVPKIISTPKVENKEAKKEEVAVAIKNKEVNAVDKTVLQANITRLEAALSAVDETKVGSSALASAKVALENAKATLANDAATEQDVETQTKRAGEQAYVVASMPKAGVEKKEVKEGANTIANSGKNDPRNGQVMPQGTGLRAGVTLQADDADGKITDATVETGKKWLEDHGYKTLKDVPVTTDKEKIAKLNDQIQWLNFSDSEAWTGLNAYGQLTVGAKYKKEVAPNYIVELTVKELKPFSATEVYRERVAGTSHEATYDANSDNKYRTGTTGIGGAPQTNWAMVKKSGFDTGDTQKTVIMGTNNNGKGNNGIYGGVVFNVSALHNGKVVRPGIVMTSGEEIQKNEAEIYTTNGTPWDLVAILGRNNAKEQYLPNTSALPKDDRFNKYADMKNSTWLSSEIFAAIADDVMLSKDTLTGGLGSQVFGPYQNNSKYATPVISTLNATEIGFYLMTSGQQATMLGIMISDFGDLPASYGVAEHSVRQEGYDYKTTSIKQIQQPYLGRVKADIDTQPGTAVRGVGSDDVTENADEGIEQLFADDHFKLNKETNEAEAKIVMGDNGTYSIKLLASANGNEQYTGQVAPAYVRGFIDFNRNGKFDDGEESDVVSVTGKDQEVTLVFNNKQIIDPQVKRVNLRVRIATERSQIENPTGIAYSGEVEDSQVYVPTPPSGDLEETTGRQGEVQFVGVEFVNHSDKIDFSKIGSNNGKTTFNSYGKRIYTDDGNEISLATTKEKQNLGVMIVKPDGSLTREYTEERVGKYEVTDDKVKFTPLADFVGKAKGIILRAVDANGQSTGWTSLSEIHGLGNVNEGTHTTSTKTMDAVYIPAVIAKELEATPKTSTGLQGKAQKETPTFNFDNDKVTSVAPSVQYPVKLVDPMTNKVTDEPVVDAQNEAGEKIGTYTINPTTGEITFQPNTDFVGKPKPATVSLTTAVGQDKDGTVVMKTATTTYSPTVTGVTPTAILATSKDIQGTKQEGIPTFAPGDKEVPLATDKYKLLDKEEKEVKDGETTPAYAENGTTVIGTYGIDKTTGKVTFTPTDKTYVGKVTPVKVQGEDINGTKVTTTYTPEIVGVTPTAAPATSKDVQGATQEGTPTFTGGEGDVNGIKKTVEIDAGVPAKLIDPTTGQPTGEKTVTVPWEGTYTVEPSTGKVTFKPEPRFTGQAKGIEVRRVDKNGLPTTATYTPTVVPVTPTATPDETTGIQGAVQTGTITFTSGKATINGKEKEVPIKTGSAVLLGNDGNPVTPGMAVDALAPNGKKVGEYKVNPVTNEVTFTPTDKSYVGEVRPVKVQGEDENGTKATATYTPHIIGVKPSVTPASSKDIQGTTQEKEVIFTAGSTNIDGKTEKAELDLTKFTLLGADGNKAQSVPAKDLNDNEVGMYTLKVVEGKPVAIFTPTDKKYVGKVQPVIVQGEDTNGTKVTATYTPEVVGVSPVAAASETKGVQGATQTSRIVYDVANNTDADKTTLNFAKGSATVNDEVKSKELNKKSVKLVSATNGVVNSEGTEVKVENQGTYVLVSDVDGAVSVQFKPLATFIGKANPVTVSIADENGTTVETTYTPTVDPVEVQATPATSEANRGVKQTGKVTITPPEIGEGVKLSEAVVTFDNGQTTKVVDGVGTYTVDKEGNVTFTPVASYEGGTPIAEKVKVKYTLTAEDGTTKDLETETTYQAKVNPITSKGNDIKTMDLQGVDQHSTDDEDKLTYTISDESKITKRTYAFEDGTTTKVVENVGTYEVDNKGQVTFTPEEDYATTKATPAVTVTVVETATLTSDDNSTAEIKTKSTYTPRVIAVYGSVEAKYVDEQGKDLSDKVKVVSNDRVGTKYTTENKTFTGYTLEKVTTTVNDKEVTGKTTGDGKVAEGSTTVTYVYKKNDQKATITYVDVTNIANKVQLGDVDAKDGKYNDKIDYATETRLENLLSKGYELVVDGFTTDGGRVYDADNAKNNYVVEVKQRILPITPTTPDVEPGKPVTPTDPAPWSESVKDLQKQLTKEVKRTVKYRYIKKDGDVADVDVVQSVKFTRVAKVNLVTGAVEFGKWTEDKTLEAVTSPVKANYRIDRVKVDELTVTADSEDSEEYVIYTPLAPTATPSVSTDIQGKEQKGTPTYKHADGTELKPTNTNPARFVGTTNTTIPATKDGKQVGIYTLEPNSGKVTFVPNKDFVGTADPVEVEVTDPTNKEVTKAKYTPTVTPITPTGESATSVGPKGKVQNGTPTFTPGHKDVPLDNKAPATFEDGSVKKVVPGEGSYEVEPSGEVTFTPEPNYVGTTNGVTVVRKDINGTEAKAKYTPTVRPETKFVDKKGDPIPGTAIEDGTKESKPIRGYRFFKSEKDDKGNITHVYEKVKTSYVTKDGKEIPSYPTKDGELPKENIPGYKLVETKKLPNGDTEHVYEKVTTSYVTKDGKEIPSYPTKDGELPKENIPGYKLVETKKLPNGDTEHVYEKVKTLYVTKDGKEIPSYPTKDGELPKENIPGYKLVETKKLPNGDTEHVYEKVTTSYVTKDGKEIPSYPTKEGELPKENIPGYKLVETKKLPNGDTEHVYEKVTTSYVTKDGKEIPSYPTKEGELPKENIPGYKLVRTNKLPNGDTEHVYEKVKTVHIDPQGNPIPGTTTEEGEQPKKEIPGYRYVETKVLPNGDTQHIYEKLVPPTTPQLDNTTSYEDESGNPLRPTERGIKGEKDIPGYEYVRTVVDVNGNVRHIYRKVAVTTPAKEKQLPNTSANNNANAAGLGMLGMLGLLGLRRRKENK